MGLLDTLKANKMGQKAYNTHVQANDLNRRGRMAEAREKYAEAMNLYEQAYQAGCRKTGAMMSYSVLMMRQGEFERARALMKEISQGGGLSEEMHFELRMNYAICLWRMGILDKAIETAQYAGKYTKNSSYYSALGTFLVDQAGRTGDFEAAKALLDDAMEYDDEDAATLDNYGEYYRLLSMKDAAEGDEASAQLHRNQAKAFYEKAYKAKPAQITTLYALANLCKEDGDEKRARELVEKAIVHSSSKVCPISMEQLQALKASLSQ